MCASARDVHCIVQYRCYFILIFSLYFRTQSGTIFLCTVSSCAFKMKELASHLGGWSTLMRQSQGNRREGEHPILTMVSHTKRLNFYSFLHFTSPWHSNSWPAHFLNACMCMYGNYGALYVSDLFWWDHIFPSILHQLWFAGKGFDNRRRGRSKKSLDAFGNGQESTPSPGGGESSLPPPGCRCRWQVMQCRESDSCSEEVGRWGGRVSSSDIIHLILCRSNGSDTEYVISCLEITVIAARHYRQYREYNYKFQVNFSDSDSCTSQLPLIYQV